MKNHSVTASSRFVDAYLGCALWSSNDDDGEPLDNSYSIFDIAPESREAALSDCADFIAQCGPDMEGLDEIQCGLNFWLTRNGHGAGFWDRGYGPKGDRLTAACKAYGSLDPCVGDDGMVYLT